MRLRLAWLLVFVLLALPASASALVLPSQTPLAVPAPNGPVTAVAADGDTVYVAGNFTQLGMPTGTGVEVSPTTAARNAALPVFNTDVTAVVSDGAGGWYVGGDFDRVGTETTGGVVHLNPDGSLDTSFAPPATLWDPSALFYDQVANKLYASGDFGALTVGGPQRLARVDGTTGAVDTGWLPNPNSYVADIAVDPASNSLYAVGSFTQIGGQARTGVALIKTDDSGTAAAGFSANTTTAADANSSASVVSLGKQKLYIAGAFDKVGGNSHPKAAQLDPGTGAPTAWNPQADGPIFTIVADDPNGKVYLGGQFGHAGGQARKSLARVDNTNGDADSWAADVDPNPVNSAVGNDVRSLVRDGTTLYVGGTFNKIDFGGGPVVRHGAAALDISGGTPSLTEWDPNVGVYWPSNQAVQTLAVQGSGVFIGGNFSFVGGSDRDGLAAIDGRTGALLPFSHTFDGQVQALTVAGGKLYAGGGFAAVDGTASSRVAAFDLPSGTLTAGFSPGVVTGFVYSLLAANGHLYVGKSNGLVAMDPTTGASQAVTPSIGTGAVRALAADGSTIYAGGDFTAISGRDLLLAFDETGAVSNNFAPALGSAGKNVKALHIIGSSLYAGGSFTSPRNHLAAFDKLTGDQMLAWTPPWSTFSGSPGVYSLFGFDGKVWALGKPTSIFPTAASGNGGLGILDPSSGAAVAGFYPGFDQEAQAGAVVGGRFWVGGWFKTLGGPAKTFVGTLAAFGFPAPAVTTAPAISGLSVLGQVLSCSDGTWSNEPVKFARQWLRDGTAIDGATSSNHTVSFADLGRSLKCAVTATAASGARATASSEPVSVLQPTGGGSTPAPVTQAPGTGAVTTDPNPLDLQLFFEMKDVKKLVVNPLGRFRVPVGCYEKDGCSGVLTVLTRPSKGKKGKTLARQAFTSINDKTFIRVTLSKKAMRAFGRAKSLKVIIKIAVHDRSLNRATLQLPYTLRR